MCLVKNVKFVLVSLAIVLSVGACTKKQNLESPASVLEAYVKTAINAKSGSDKARLYEYTTGTALQKLQAMSEEDFTTSLIKPEFKFVHFSTRDQREETTGGISLVYELVYENTAGEGSAKTTSRKIAYMKKEGSTWKIEDTRNIKAFVEVKDGLNIQFP
jgi:hypothetical protein